MIQERRYNTALIANEILDQLKCPHSNGGYADFYVCLPFFMLSTMAERGFLGEWGFGGNFYNLYNIYNKLSKKFSVYAVI